MILYSSHLLIENNPNLQKVNNPHSIEGVFQILLQSPDKLIILEKLYEQTKQMIRKESIANPRLLETLEDIQEDILPNLERKIKHEKFRTKELEKKKIEYLIQKQIEKEKELVKQEIKHLTSQI